MNIGDNLLLVLKSAKNTVRIAAPFIKVQALTRVLECVSDNVDVICIARWRPEDIASGVCDLEIFDIIKARERSTFLIHPYLHAKFYSADTSCLVGSANLSNTALGWRRPSNHELLVPLEISDHGLEIWWKTLFYEAIEVTEEIRLALEQNAADLRDSVKQNARQDVGVDQDSTKENMIWVPECPRWDGLWEVYFGDEEQLPKSAIKSAKSDLEALQLPLGMDKTNFEKVLKIAIKNTRIFQEVDHLSEKGITDDKAQELLINKFGISKKDASRRWGVIKQWFIELYPKDLKVLPQQEVLIKGRDF